MFWSFLLILSSSVLQNVTTGMEDGFLMTAGHYILVSAAKNGFLIAGHADWHSERISHMRNSDGSLKAVTCQNFKLLSSWQGKFWFAENIQSTHSSSSASFLYLSGHANPNMPQDAGQNHCFCRWLLGEADVPVHDVHAHRWGWSLACRRCR